MKRRDHLRGRHSRGPETPEPPPPPLILIPALRVPCIWLPEILQIQILGVQSAGDKSGIAKDHPDPLMRLFVQRKLHQLLCRGFGGSQLVLSRYPFSLALRCAKIESAEDATPWTITARK
jgi:hypothetical protein